MSKKKQFRISSSDTLKKKRRSGGVTSSLMARLLNALLLPSLTQPDAPLWRALPWLLLLAFILRAAVALAGDFVIHPDEIMQYLEPAHGLVFGNDVTYWEYYYGARSWLVPFAVALVLSICKLIGLASPEYYIAAVKLFFCLLSLSVPLALYIIARRLFCETTARIALILGVFWYELVGFAHKGMTEFVATSLLMLLTILVLQPQPQLTRRQAVGMTALGVLIIAVRFQYMPLVALLLLFPYLRNVTPIRLLMAGSAAVVAALVGLLDYATWGGFLHPYLLNFKVNLLLNVERQGESSAFNFIGWLAVASGGIFLLSLVVMLNNYRRRLFFILVISVILLPHMMQAHREYRFIYVLLPFLLLLFADFLARGWGTDKKSVLNSIVRPRPLIGLGYAALVSAAGIANALPMQYWVYEAKSRETGYVHFLRNQDETLQIYRQLAKNDAVLGVKDATRPYFNTGGYYYLHKQIPFYDAITALYPPAQTKDYVSHVVAGPLIEPGGLVQLSNNALAMRTLAGGLFPLPRYISDAALNQLVYWNQNGKATVVEGFVIDERYEQFTVWRREDNTAPVRQWQRYQIAPDNESMYRYIEKIEGANAKQPVKNAGIEFSGDTSDK